MTYLQIAEKAVNEKMENYYLYEVIPPLMNFVDELTNWYVRSNRKRFWKEKGIDDIICISVNDPFVMNAWGKENNVGDKIIMMGDPFLNFTKDIGADVDKSGRGLGIRSNRYTMYVEDMKVIKLQEEKDTGSCEISAAENFLNLV